MSAQQRAAQESECLLARRPCRHGRLKADPSKNYQKARKKSFKRAFLDAPVPARFSFSERRKHPRVCGQLSTFFGRSISALPKPWERWIPTQGVAGFERSSFRQPCGRLPGAARLGRPPQQNVGQDPKPSPSVQLSPTQPMTRRSKGSSDCFWAESPPPNVSGGTAS